MNEFDEFKRQWGVDGMSADKIKLATASFKAGMIVAAEIANSQLNACTVSQYSTGEQCLIARNAKEEIEDEIRAEANKL